jgi:predicted PhzF superfamily epimerase YddE/YHI9
MRTVRFKQVDVFTARPFLGNPVAVILDAQGLADAEMARIAAWTNLSETTFVLPSARASYRLRIFTPRSELPFAGHPTIGSAHAVREAGLVASDAPLVQECAAGLIPLAVGPDGAIAARVPAARLTPFPHATALGDLLGTPVADPRVVDVGPRWIIADVGSAAVLRGLTPDLRAMIELNRRTDTTGVTVYAVDGTARGAKAAPPPQPIAGGSEPFEGSEVDVGATGVELRSFAPLHGIAEDPVCGSGNASVGAYLHATGGLARFPGGRYLARQGAAVGRAGEIQVSVDASAANDVPEIRIGGRAVTVIEGTIRLA